ncbi:MAG: hypothetical protein FJ257_02150 [Phycisphaerae bacterium]|nr:hypothetical protein [Phycisphaerae bacterium]
MPTLHRLLAFTTIAFLSLALSPALLHAAPPKERTLAEAPPAEPFEVIDRAGVVRTLPDRPDLLEIRLGSREVIRARQVAATRLVWEGEVEGRRGSLVLLVTTSLGPVISIQDEARGSIEVFPLDADQRGRMRIVRSDEPHLPCGGAELLDGGATPSPREGGVAGAPCDSGARTDVLIRFTPAAQAQAGGEVAIRSLAEAAVAVANHVYLMSGVPTRLHVVDLGPSGPFTNDAGSGVVASLRSPDDGILDEVHAERDALGADLVALITGTHPSYCGVAYLISGEDPAAGFSVTVWSCAVGNMTFAHELGHNQGCCHAPGDGGGCNNGGVFPYSVGYRFVGASGTQWRSILAYSPGIRWPRLSSPNVIHDGMPFGVPGGQGGQGGQGADNARTVQETAPIIANFRCEVVAPVDPAIRLDSLERIPPTAGGSISFVTPSVPPAAAGTTVELEMIALADLGDGNESLRLRIGSVTLPPAISGTGTDCRLAVGWNTLSAAEFNAQITAGGSLAITIVASSSVGAECAGSLVRVIARYEVAPVLGDLNDDGIVNGADLAILLGAWGACSGCAADLNDDGIVNGTDLSILLGAWSA